MKPNGEIKKKLIQWHETKVEMLRDSERKTNMNTRCILQSEINIQHPHQRL